MSLIDFNNNETQVRGKMKPVGYAQYTAVGATTAISLNTAPNTGLSLNSMNTTFEQSNQGKIARIAVIMTEVQALRWMDDGSANLSATVGMPLPVGQMLVYDGDLQALKLIAQVAGATIDVTYYA